MSPWVREWASLCVSEGRFYAHAFYDGLPNQHVHTVWQCIVWDNVLNFLINDWSGGKEWRMVKWIGKENEVD